MSPVRQHLPRWALSLALVLGLHIGLGVLALHWHKPTLAVELPPAALMVQLAPLPAAAPPPPPAPAALPKPQPLPPPVVAAKPKLVLEKPRPKARPTPPKPQVTPPVQSQPAPLAKAAEPAPVAAPSAPAAASFAPANNAASKAAKQSWQSHLLSHLARYKRYPEHARRRGIEGTSQVRFSLDAQGRVLSVALAKSSGNAALDSATLAMIRRASPVPKPPAELLSNGHLEVVAPFIYNLERS